MRHFLWKATAKALPVGEALTRRGIGPAVFCKRCGAVETEIHVLFLCPFAVKVWELAPTIFNPAAEASITVHKLLQVAPKMVNLPPTGLRRTPLYPWIVWHLWTARNKFIFDDKAFSFSEVDIVTKAVRGARNWKEAQFALPKQKITCSPSPAPAPSASEFSCFVDAAWSSETGNCGMGWFFQKNDNSIRLQGSASRSCVGSALVAEALALRCAVAAAAVLKIDSVNVFSDSQTLISLLSSREASNELKGVLHDIVMLCSSFVVISFFHFLRLSNVVADALAKSALPSVVTPTAGG